MRCQLLGAPRLYNHHAHALVFWINQSIDRSIDRVDKLWGWPQCAVAVLACECTSFRSGAFGGAARRRRESAAAGGCLRTHKEIIRLVIALFALQEARAPQSISVAQKRFKADSRTTVCRPPASSKANCAPDGRRLLIAYARQRSYVYQVHRCTPTYTAVQYCIAPGPKVTVFKRIQNALECNNVQPSPTPGPNLRLPKPRHALRRSHFTDRLHGQMPSIVCALSQRKRVSI